MVDALAWPPSMRSPTDLQKVLMGFPFFGPDKRAYRDFRRQVSARPESCLEQWKPDEATRLARDRIFGILRDEMGWEMIRFVPEDPCEILFFDPSMELNDVCALLQIDKLFGCKFDANRLLDMNVGGLVDELVAAGKPR